MGTSRKAGLWAGALSKPGVDTQKVLAKLPSGQT